MQTSLVTREEQAGKSGEDHTKVWSFLLQRNTGSNDPLEKNEISAII